MDAQRGIKKPEKSVRIFLTTPKSSVIEETKGQKVQTLKKIKMLKLFQVHLVMIRGRGLL